MFTPFIGARLARTTFQPSLRFVSVRNFGSSRQPAAKPAFSSRILPQIKPKSFNKQYFSKRGYATESEVIIRPSKEEAWKRYAISAVCYHIQVCWDNCTDLEIGYNWRYCPSCSNFFQSRDSRLTGPV